MVAPSRNPRVKPPRRPDIRPAADRSTRGPPQIAIHTDPEQVHAHHAAGLGGFGGSSKLDEVILRDRDTTGNGTLDERLYTLQNQRGDVALVVTDGCVQVERIAYAPYGQPFGFAAGDTDFDGDHDTTDADAITNWNSDGKPWRAYADVNSDGTVDSDDASAASTVALGRGVLSHTDTANRRGYAGYWRDDAIPELYHVRRRPYQTTLGRFISRDPAEYVDGANLYAYARGNPVAFLDPNGLAACVVPESGSDAAVCAAPCYTNRCRRAAGESFYSCNIKYTILGIGGCNYDPGTLQCILRTRGHIEGIVCRFLVNECVPDIFVPPEDWCAWPCRCPEPSWWSLPIREVCDIETGRTMWIDTTCQDQYGNTCQLFIRFDRGDPGGVVAVDYYELQCERDVF